MTKALRATRGARTRAWIHAFAWGVPLGCGAIHAREDLRPVAETRPDGESSLTSRVAVVYGERVLTVASDDQTPPTLVLAPLRVTVKPGDPLRMRGSLRPFVVNEVERDLGIRLDPALVRAFEGKQVFVAESIEVLHPLPPPEELEDDDPL